jgi:general secretion pathway protein C
MLTGLVWVCAGWSAAYWGLRWWGHAPPEAVPVAAQEPRHVDMTWVAKALGTSANAVPVTDVAAPVPVVRTSRVVLAGVATDAQGQGVALLGMDGQPPVAVRVGAILPDGWVLHRLEKSAAVLRPPDGQTGELTLTVP